MTRAGIWGARADHRGLARQSEDAARHLPFDRILGFDLTVSGRSPYPCDWSGYPQDVLTVVGSERGGRTLAREWLDGLDVVLAFETFYHDDFPAWADEAGVKTVLVANPEFYRHEREPHLPRPTVVVNPSPWRMETMPGAVQLTWPVDRDRITFTPRGEHDGPLRWLHVVGHRAAADRAGTANVLEAARLAQRPAVLTIRTQDDVSVGKGRGNVKVEVVRDDVSDHSDLYGWGDVLVSPRRYGGQSLPLNEGTAAGLVPVMSDVSPQNGWLPSSLLVPAVQTSTVRTPSGLVPVFDTDPRMLAARLDGLSDDRDGLVELSWWADGWASERSWETLGGVWAGLLADPAGRVAVV